MTDAPPEPPPQSSYAVFRLRDFRLYLIGRLFAACGQQMLTVAVGWELYERTGSALALGFVGLSEMIAMVVLTLPAGHVADNFNRQRIVMAGLAVAACSSLALAVISRLHAPVFWIYACLFTTAASRTFLWPASSAFLTSLVPRELFPRAVTWNSGTFQLSSVAGPAAGGALLAALHTHSDHPAAFVYALNAVAALTCLTLVAMVRHRHHVAQREPLTLRSIAAGFRFVFANRIILGTITLDMFAVLLGGATALLPMFAKDVLHAGPDGLGILQAALPVGAMACALTLAHRPPLAKAGRAMLWSVALFGVATIGFGLSRSFWLSFALLCLCGAADNISVVVRHTLVQLLTPDEKRGRVSAVNSLFIGTSNELGGFESGTVAHLCGPVIGYSLATGATISVVSGGIGTILVVIAVAWLWPEIRQYGRLDATPPPTS